jgi:hypothetical protein
MGETLIIEGTFSREGHWEPIAHLEECFPNLRIKIVCCVVPHDKEEETIIGRARKRQGNPSGATSLDDYLRVKNRFIPITRPHFKLDTTQPVDECVGQVLLYLGG